MTVPMRHVAILSPRLKFLSKIICGEKTIESRWMKTRRAPWNRVAVDDQIFLKEGPLVTHVAGVERVLQFENLDEEGRKEILRQYGKELGMDVSNRPAFEELTKGKRYCVLIFLSNVRALTRPFKLDKKGYGTMAGWCVLGQKYTAPLGEKERSAKHLLLR